MNMLNTALLGLGAGLALVVLLVVIWLGLTDMHLRSELQQALTEGTALRAANDQFRQQATQQDAAVTALQAAGAANAARAAAAERLAAKSAASLQADIARLKKLRAPGQTDEDCTAAAALFDPFIARSR